MIGVKLDGRLGNQLFQYAFAWSMSKKLDTCFYLDTRQEMLIDKYFDLPMPLFNRIIKPMGFKWGKRIRIYILIVVQKMLKQVVVSDEMEPALLLKDIRNNTFYEGFFQSRLFFRSQENELKKIFKIRQQYKINSADFFDPAYNSILLHVRRTDYFNTFYEDLNTHDISLSKEYFYSALKYITGLIKSNYKIYVVSDDIELVKSEFHDVGYDINFMHNHLTIDLQLIMNADYLIISNSTFSWWGAFLNNKVKIVVAPHYWCGFSQQRYYPKGIAHGLDWKWM